MDTCSSHTFTHGEGEGGGEVGTTSKGLKVCVDMPSRAVQGKRAARDTSGVLLLVANHNEEHELTSQPAQPATTIPVGPRLRR